MIDRLRRNLTYANLMATLALFIALGGASYAAVKIPAKSVGTTQLKQRSVGEQQLKLNSVGQKQLRDGAVGSPELQGNSVTNDHIAPGVVGTRELRDGAIERADLAPTAAMPRLFAHVSSSGVLGESAGVVRASRVSKGTYEVDFDRGLRGCVAVASVGFGFGPGVIGAGGTAQARMNAGNNANTVQVTVYRKGYTFNDVEDNDVHLIVAC